MAHLNKSTENYCLESTERICAFDALRGIMMLLGIIIHAAITYGSIDYKTTWPLKDPNNHFSFDIIVSLIHSFRMPVFFVTAGYFGALLFYKKGASAMLQNRVKRILLPFGAAVLFIYPFIVGAFAFSRASFKAEIDAFDKALFVLLSGSFLPFKVVHLWFLYFLVFYSLAGWLLASVFRETTPFTKIVNGLYRYIIQRFWLRLVVMSALFFACLYWMGTPFIKTNTTFSIDPAILATYFVFFGTGWLLYRANCLNQLSSYPVMQLGAAFFLFLLSVFAPWPAEDWTLMAKQALLAVYSSLFIFGFLALFLTYFNTFSPKFNYLMEASYWVYLIHLPIVAAVPGILTGLAIPVGLKFTIVLLVTGVICLASYHYAVRSSFIGMFLNGKVYRPKKIAHPRELVSQI